MKFCDLCKQLEATLDEHLKDYYVSTECISNLKSSNKSQSIIVGYKGSGKTTTFRYLTEFEPTDIVIAIDPNNFSLELPKTNLSWQTCSRQFENDLILESLYAIKSNKTLFEKLPRGLQKKIKKNLPNNIDKILKVFKRGGGASVLGCGFNLNPATLEVSPGLHLLEDYKSALETLQETTEKDIKIRIVVDNPEHVFSSSFDLDIGLLGGFLLAATKMNILIKNLNVTVLIKSHVFDPIYRIVDDLHNYPDNISHLFWTPQELISMVDRRLETSEDSWETIFYNGKETGEKLIEYMSHNIRNGPRDILRWLLEILKEYEGKNINKTLSNNVKAKMGKDSFDALVTAHSLVYEKLDDVIKAIFRENGDKIFTKT